MRLSTIAVLALLFAGSVRADMVELKDGSRIKGTVLSMDADTVDLQTPNGLFKLDRRNVAGIRYSDRETEAAETIRRAVEGEGNGAESEGIPEGVETPSVRPVPVRSPTARGETEFERAFSFRGGVKGSNKELESGPWFEANFLFDVEKNFYIGPGVGYWKGDNELETLAAGEVTSVPIFLKMRLDAGDEQVRPYLEFAFGYFLMDNDIDTELQDALAFFGLRVEEEVQDDTGAMIAAGIDFAVAETAWIGLHVGYMSLKPEVEGTIYDSFGDSISYEDDVKLGGVYGGVSLTGRF